MSGEIAPATGQSLAIADGFAALPIPAVIAREGEQAAMKFVEFVTANIRNPNTRIAYARAVYQFLNWSEERRLPLHNLNPIFVSAYIEQLQASLARTA